MVHALPPEELTGTPLLAAGYASEMARRDWEVVVLYASNAVLDWDEVEPTRWPGEHFTRVAVPRTPSDGTYWPVFGPSMDGGPSPASVPFERLLTELAPDLVHVVDNVDLPLDWPERAKARSIPVIRTVSCTEDLCGLIPPVSPISDPIGYCLPPLTPERCARCLISTGGFPSLETSPCEGTSGAAGIGDDATGSPEERWNGRLIELLERKRARTVAQYSQTFDRIVFSSRGFRSYFESTLPLDPERVVIIPLGVDPLPGQRHNGASKAGEKPLVFGYAGVLVAAKGVDELSATFLRPELVERDDYRLVILGGGDTSLVTELLATNKNVSWLGPYRPEDLPGHLAGIDVGLSTSRFETFHRVTREYLLSGVPVIGSLAFGIPEVVRHGENGLLFDHAEPGSLLRAVTDCLNDPALLARITQGAQATEIRTAGDEVDDLLALYGSCL